MVMDPGLRIEPQLAPGPEGPIQSADRSTATVGGVDQSFSWDLVRSGSRMFCDRNEKDADWECQRRSLAADEGAAVPNATKTEIKHKGDRHVGLDFYDLLIEAIEAAAEATKLSELSMERVAWRLRERAGHNVSERWSRPRKNNCRSRPYCYTGKAAGNGDRRANKLPQTCRGNGDVVSRRRKIVMLYERWREALRSRPVGGGFKLP